MKVMAFVAHPDDEINCGGVLLKNKEEEGETLVVCFTGSDERVKELKNSCKILGAEMLNLQFPELAIPYDNKLRLKLMKLIREFQPEIVILQANDYHPDHQQVNKILLETLEFAAHSDKGWVVKHIIEMETSGLLTYPDVIFDVSDEFENKVKAFECHNSQVKEKSFGHFYLEFLEAKGRLRGVQIGSKYGEAYKLHRQKVQGNFYPFSLGIKKLSTDF